MVSLDEAKLAIARETRVFFGHQSVGANILDGLSELCLNNVNTRDPAKPIAQVDAPILHAYVGRNTYANEKMIDFAQILDGRKVGDVDVAMLKFCYVDTGHDLSAQKIFDLYVT